ncbi:tyrosine-type recombinase/integrase [Neisseria sp. Ec49-e6-T10]|uniref:tyrosine-type recombinase/integrase n=1 Tax=Neisseria sp. Ec49-e6-T10 TaxID=3140744 RepID=UPI003EBB0C39
MGDLKNLIDKLPNEGKLLRNEKGKNLTYSMFCNLFNQARINAGVNFNDFQFKDLRAKAGTDKEEIGGMAAAKDQLGHASETMTKHYVRNRLGKKTTPTK